MTVKNARGAVQADGRKSPQSRVLLQPGRIDWHDRGVILFVILVDCSIIPLFSFRGVLVCCCYSILFAPAPLA